MRITWPGRFVQCLIETRHDPLTMEEREQIVIQAQLYRNNRLVTIALSLPDIAQLEQTIARYRDR